MRNDYISQLELSSVARAMTQKLNRCSVENVNSYLFQFLAVDEAECLIVQNTTRQCMNVFYCLENELSLHAEIIFKCHMDVLL